MRQIILNFQKNIIENIKEKCSVHEKRSLTAQLRILLEKVPGKEGIPEYLKWKFSKKTKTDSELTKTSVKIPEEEYWSAVEKAAKGHMTIPEFCTLVLELWEKNDLISDIYNLKETATGCQKDIIATNKVTETKYRKNKNLEKITLEYHWIKDVIEISWETDHFFSGELWVVFRDSTGEIIGEFPLGKKKKSSKKIRIPNVNISLKDLSPMIIEKREE